MAKIPSIPETGLPLIHDWSLRDIFEEIYKWNELQHKRLPLKLQKSKLAQEARRRQQELSKAANKADDFAPFSEFQKRFDESGKAERDSIDKQLYELHQESVEGLQKVVSVAQESVKSWVKGIATQTENGSVSALEAKFAKLEKQAAERQKEMSEAQAQIQELLKDRETSTESINTLSRDFELLKSDNANLKSDHDKLRNDQNGLQAEYSELRSNHDGLRSDYDNLRSDHDILLSKYNDLQSDHNTLQSDYDILLSKYNDLQSDHNTLQSDHETLQSTCNDLQSICNDLQSKCAEFELQVTGMESTKESNKDWNQSAEKLQSLVTRIDNTESQVRAFMGKVEDLDMETYNEILETWIDHDFKNKVISNEKLVSSTREDLQSLQELVAKGFTTSDRLISELRQNPGSAVSHPDNRTIREGEPIQNAAIEEKLNNVTNVLKGIVTQSGDLCAGMVDEVGSRVDNIEAVVKSLTSKDAETAGKLSLLEQDMSQQVANCHGLAKRVSSLEEQRLVSRIDKVGLGLASLERKVVQQQIPDTFNAIRQDLDMVRGRYDALELSIRQLDSQWSNLSSRQMAEKILAQIDPHSQRNEQRIAGVEMKLRQLEEIIASLKQNLLAKSPLDEKRQPSPRPSDPNKKRKLNESVQSPSFRSSSLGQNVDRPA
ncbi:hypothetical protein Hte_003981 [Hypoxylon texense]